MNKFRAEAIALPSPERKLWPVILALTLLLALLAGAGVSLVDAGHAWEIWHHEDQGRPGDETYEKCMPVESQNGHRDHEGDFLVGPCDPPGPTPTDEPPEPAPTDEPPEPTPTDEPPEPTPTDEPPEPTPTDEPPEPTDTPPPPEKCDLVPQYIQWRLVDTRAGGNYQKYCYVISSEAPSVERQEKICTICNDLLAEDGYRFRAETWRRGTVYLNECTGEYVFIFDSGTRDEEWSTHWFRPYMVDNVRTTPRTDCKDGDC